MMQMIHCYIAMWLKLRISLKILMLTSKDDMMYIATNVVTQ